MLRNWGFKETGTSYEQRFGFTDNQWQNTKPKESNSSKTGSDQRTFISAFAQVLTSTVKN